MSAGCVVALAIIVLAVVLGLAIIVMTFLRDCRARRSRIEAQRVVLGAEDELRTATRDTMRAMRDAIRQHTERP